MVITRWCEGSVMVVYRCVVVVGVCKGGMMMYEGGEMWLCIV